MADWSKAGESGIVRGSLAADSVYCARTIWNLLAWTPSPGISLSPLEGTIGRSIAAMSEREQVDRLSAVVVGDVGRHTPRMVRHRQRGQGTSRRLRGAGGARRRRRAAGRARIDEGRRRDPRDQRESYDAIGPRPRGSRASSLFYESATANGIATTQAPCSGASAAMDAQKIARLARRMAAARSAAQPHRRIAADAGGQKMAGFGEEDSVADPTGFNGTPAASERANIVDATEFSQIPLRACANSPSNAAGGCRNADRGKAAANGPRDTAFRSRAPFRGLRSSHRTSD